MPPDLGLPAARRSVPWSSTGRGADLLFRNFQRPSGRPPGADPVVDVEGGPAGPALRTSVIMDGFRRRQLPEAGWRWRRTNTSSDGRGAAPQSGAPPVVDERGGVTAVRL